MIKTLVLFLTFKMLLKSENKINNNVAQVRQQNGAETRDITSRQFESNQLTNSIVSFHPIPRR